jgi:regulatory protein
MAEARVEGPKDTAEDALQRALRFLAYRPRSEAEVRGDLARRGFSPATIEPSVEKLRSLNYIDDERFARDWARSRVENNGYGPKRIAQELITKGVEGSTVRDTVRETFGQGAEAKSARAILEKQFRNKNLKDPTVRRRAAAFLQRRGYGSTIIFDLLHTPIEED